MKSQVGRLVGWLLQRPVDVIKNPGSCQPALCSSSLSCVGFILHSLLWGPRLVPAFPSISKTSNGKRPFPFLRFIFVSKEIFSRLLFMSYWPRSYHTPSSKLVTGAAEMESCLLAPSPSADLTWRWSLEMAICISAQT